MTFEAPGELGERQVIAVAPGNFLPVDRCFVTASAATSMDDTTAAGSTAFPFRFRLHGYQGVRAQYCGDVSCPFDSRCPSTCHAAVHPCFRKSKLKPQVTAIQQQCRNGGADVPIMKGDNCVDFSSQRFFCQFFSYLRTHDLALLQSFHRKFSDWRPLSRCSYYVPFGSRVKSGRSGVSVAFKRKQFESPGCRCRACEGRRESCTFGANANRGARLYVEAQDIWEQMSSGKISPGIPKGRGSHRVENWRSLDEQISGICSSRGN